MELEVETKFAPAIVLESLKAYQSSNTREVKRVTRNLNGLSKDDKAALTRKPEEQVRVMEEAVQTNLQFLGKLKDLIEKTTVKADALPGLDAGAPSAKTVQTLLQLFVREWSEEGLQERSECFERLLTALDKHLGSQRDQSGAPKPRVLIPYSQLARVPFEVQKRGYQCEACEGRPLYFFGGELVRQQFTSKESQCIQPYVSNTCNRVKAEDNVRRIQMPEVDVTEFPTVRFGELVQLYDTAAARGSFDGVLTSFALDSSPNVLRFIRTVAHCTRPGGMWANFGPLAYDSEHDESNGSGMELSWEELKYAISHFFEIQEESVVEAFHAQNAMSMMQLQFCCVYFSAVRNTTPAEGIGETASPAEGK